MGTTTQSIGAVEPYLAAFERLESRRRREPSWLRTARSRAIDLFAATGFPTTRDEDWRFTNLSPVAAQVFGPADAGAGLPATAAVPRVPGVDGPVLVFVDGRYAASLSSAATGERSMTVTDLATALREDPETVEEHLGRHVAMADRPLVALNTALFEDGAVVRVEAGASIEGAVQLVFLSGSRPGTAVYPRVLVVAGANSQVRLVEVFATLGGGPTFTNAVTEIVAGDGAVVDHYRLQRESEEAFHLGITHLQIARSASASSHAVSIGGLIARHDAVAVLAGQGADCTLNGLYLGRDRQLLDSHTEIDHAAPNGTSHELYKGVLEGKARGVFNGRIRVRLDAQKTDAKQTNKTLLLSDEAQINTKPQLEILANDVKCTHGATVGQLSREALFYLRSRGIAEADARSLLIRAFAMDVLSRMRLEPVRAELDRVLALRLPGSLADEALA